MACLVGDVIPDEDDLVLLGWAHTPLEEPLDNDSDYEDSGESVLVEGQMDEGERDYPALRKEVLASKSD